MNKLLRILGSLIVFFCSSCGIVEKIEQKLNIDNFPSVSDDDELQAIPLEKLDRLKQKIIVFGHQSVGMNIVDGLKKIGDQDERFKLNFMAVTETDEISGPGFYHFGVGQNHQPQTKIDHFKKIINNAPKVDIAAMKFCYVDFKDTTNVEGLVDSYVQLYDTLKSQNPETTFLYFTCPYRSEEDALNAYRNNYNSLLIERLDKENEPIFDLAQLESTKDDGSRSTYVHEGKTYYRMNIPYTKDSGHLNAYGSFIVAKNLLIKLTEIE